MPSPLERMIDMACGAEKKVARDKTDHPAAAVVVYPCVEHAADRAEVR